MEASTAQADLRIAQKKRDEARAQTQGMGGDIISVQRDFARLFKARQQTLIDQISGLESQAADLRSKIEETERQTHDMAKQKDHTIGTKETKIDEIKQQMRKQAQEFDIMMTSILDTLKNEIEASTQPKELVNAGVPIHDHLAEVNNEIQVRAIS
mmetsp:Transcript_8330/g.10829  ORF Transcript_8330/g.10829 Transcript_8330/m.10829 type:complete len:155 (-) Transcript_8330:216-680(-)